MNRIHQKMSLEQKIQALKEDFLDRDQTTFVKIRRTGRLGWESSIPEGNRGEIELRHISLNNCVFVDNNHFNEIILLELPGISTLPNDHNVNKIISIISI